MLEKLKKRKCNRKYIYLKDNQDRKFHIPIKTHMLELNLKFYLVFNIDRKPKKHNRIKIKPKQKTKTIWKRFRN